MAGKATRERSPAWSINRRGRRHVRPWVHRRAVRTFWLAYLLIPLVLLSLVALVRLC